MTLTIGQLAERSGVAPSALRFYEDRGLITSERTTGNQRRYPASTLRRVAFVRTAQPPSSGSTLMVSIDTSSARICSRYSTTRWFGVAERQGCALGSDNRHLCQARRVGRAAHIRLQGPCPPDAG